MGVVPLSLQRGILYALFGRVMPDAISHTGFTLPRIIEHCFYSQDGIFGIMASVMGDVCNHLYLFRCVFGKSPA